MRKIFVVIACLLVAGCAFGEDIITLEREAHILKVEFNRLGKDGDPLEREAVLRKIIDNCKGTEEGESAYWELADLYLDSFPEERRKEAREMLELCLKNYPDSSRAVMIKCRLVDLYDDKDSKRADLIRTLKADKNLPNLLRASM
ncbi:MAG: hypothetical protein IJT21_06235 [Synergistaceae bacterium]|nr:hypothetical protein [Synergistaceae bacterium]